MGVPAEKATKAAQCAAEELRTVADILVSNPAAIYPEGRAALACCRHTLAGIMATILCGDVDENLGSR